jgi:hypothetical protein
MTCGVVFAVGASCRSTLEPPSGDITFDLVHGDPRIRAISARDAVRILEERREADASSEEPSRRRIIELLVSNLDDEDDAVRFFTAIALRKVTGLDLGYRASATVEKREEAMARWRTWLDSKGPEDLTQRPGRTPPVREDLPR